MEETVAEKTQAAAGPVSRKRQGEFVTRLRGMNSPDRTPDYSSVCPLAATVAGGGWGSLT